jgi:hypothetical protein
MCRMPRNFMPQVLLFVSPGPSVTGERCTGCRDPACLPRLPLQQRDEGLVVQDSVFWAASQATATADNPDTGRIDLNKAN